MRGGSRQLHRTGQCTATAGMGQQRRLSKFTVGPLAPNTHGQSRRTACYSGSGRVENGRGSLGPMASAPIPVGSTGCRMPSRGGPLAFLLASSRTYLREHGRKISRSRFSVHVTLGHNPLSLRGKAGADFQSGTGGQGRTGEGYNPYRLRKSLTAHARLMGI